MLNKSYSDRFRHIQAYSDISKNYSGIFRIVCNHGIFRTVTYPELWHIQNQMHIQNPGIFISDPWHIHNPDILRTPIYSERWHIQNTRHIQNLVKHLGWSMSRKWLTAIITFTNYNYFGSINLLGSLLHEINISIFLIQV